MYDLPTQWHLRRIDSLQPSDCIYGLGYDSSQLTCGFYVTNFDKVWMEELDREDLSKRARELGIDGLTDEKLRLILDTLVKGIPNKVNFKQNSELVHAQVDLDFAWKFQLQGQPPETVIQFLSKLNFQQFSNISYLRYEIGQLKHVLEAKESYSRFLELNFKQAHGESLIKQYKKNNKEVIHLITNFNKQKWENEIKEEYLKSRQQDAKAANKLNLENAIACNFPARESQLPSSNKSLAKRAPTSTPISPSKRSRTNSLSLKESPKRKKIGQL
ncbi:hypothetical protein KGF57_003527 [Candida theae]|uniref:XLF-like N-terminal domain-containing protein n=1 Tax=Candida theae TaxID=1198502 RepID=A0AAD5BD14_9ASCO|nr:uncharacterized protein KGF57_003527 [Candida theae]KAI5956041.1 hypothetical protein KGF57_003527 [Candida theae]